MKKKIVPVWPWLVFWAGVAAGTVIVLLVWVQFERMNDIRPFFSSFTNVVEFLAPVDEGGEPVRLKAIDDALVSTAFASKESWQVPRDARVLLVPHHLIAARELASLFTSTPTPSRIIVLAPDHLSRGRTPFTIANAPFTSSAGHVKANASHVTRLADALAARVTLNAELFPEEPGFPELVTMVRTAWDVPVMPLLVRADASLEDRAALAEWIAAELRRDKNALLIASVDFSHDLPAEVADFHDVLAEDVIKSLADLEADKVELDSPSILATALKTARMLGLGNVTIHAHTNALKLAQTQFTHEGTSHFLASFAPGAVQAQNDLTLLFFGDLMFDRLVRTQWLASSNNAFPFQALQGKEFRFFHGQDFIVGNLECPVTATRRAPEKEIDFACDPGTAKRLADYNFAAVSQANNHALDQGREGAEESRRILRDAGIAPFGDQVRDDAENALTVLKARDQSVALLGWNTTDNPLNRTDAAAAIAAAKQSATYTIVFLHWGVEYTPRPSGEQTELAHWLIDQGVDAVIGAHPHWMQSVEMYNGKPIAYSLGNAVFDQNWSTETQQGLLAGLALGENGPALHLFPIKIERSQPALLTGADRTARLEYLASISDPTLADAIKSGILR